MMVFRTSDKEYSGASALDIVRALQRDAADARQHHVTPREYLRWAHAQLRDRVPARDLDVSDRLSDETLALNYLCLCDEYGVAELSGGPQRVL
jgi:hypothetical protein